jgi:hypothetical protein
MTTTTNSDVLPRETYGLDADKLSNPDTFRPCKFGFHPYLGCSQIEAVVQGPVYARRRIVRPGTKFQPAQVQICCETETDLKAGERYTVEDVLKNYATAMKEMEAFEKQIETDIYKEFKIDETEMNEKGVEERKTVNYIGFHRRLELLEQHEYFRQKEVKENIQGIMVSVLSMAEIAATIQSQMTFAAKQLNEILQKNEACRIAKADKTMGIDEVTRQRQARKCVGDLMASFFGFPEEALRVARNRWSFITARLHRQLLLFERLGSTDSKSKSLITRIKDSVKSGVTNVWTYFKWILSTIAQKLWEYKWTVLFGILTVFLAYFPLTSPFLLPIITSFGMYYAGHNLTI